MARKLKNETDEEKKSFKGYFVFEDIDYLNTLLQKAEDEFFKINATNKVSILRHKIKSKLADDIISKLTKLEGSKSEKNGDIEITIFGSEDSHIRMEKNSNGKFDFKSKGDFSGVVLLDRIDENGKLIENSQDIIIYKNGKVAGFIEGEKGESRLNDIGKYKKKEIFTESARNQQDLPNKKMSAQTIKNSKTQTAESEQGSTIRLKHSEIAANVDNPLKPEPRPVTIGSTIRLKHSEIAANVDNPHKPKPRPIDMPNPTVAVREKAHKKQAESRRGIHPQNAFLHRGEPETLKEVKNNLKMVPEDKKNVHNKAIEASKSIQADELQKVKDNLKNVSEDKKNVHNKAIEASKSIHADELKKVKDSLKKIHRNEISKEDKFQNAASLKSKALIKTDSVEIDISPTRDAIIKKVKDVAQAAGGMAIDTTMAVSKAVGNATIATSKAVGNAAVGAAKVTGGVAIDTTMAASKAVGNATMSAAQAASGMAIDATMAVGNAALNASKTAGGIAMDGAIMTSNAMLQMAKSIASLTNNLIQTIYNAESSKSVSPESTPSRPKSKSGKSTSK